MEFHVLSSLGMCKLQQGISEPNENSNLLISLKYIGLLIYINI